MAPPKNQVLGTKPPRPIFNPGAIFGVGHVTRGPQGAPSGHAGAVEALRKGYGYYEKGHEYQEQFEKYRGYYERLMRLVEEDSRTGAIFNEGLGLAKKLVQEILGEDLAEHPYFALHKKHFEILTKFLDASATYENAKKYRNEAVEISETVQIWARRYAARLSRNQNELERRIQRKLRQWKWYDHYRRKAYMFEGMDKAQALAYLRDIDRLIKFLLRELDPERLEAEAAYIEVLAVATRLRIDIERCREAMRKYWEKVEKLKQGGTIGQLFHGILNREEEIEQIDRAAELRDENTWSVPVRAAREGFHDLESEICDVGGFAGFVARCFSNDILLIRAEFGAKWPWELADESGVWNR